METDVDSGPLETGALVLHGQGLWGADSRPELRNEELPLWTGAGVPVSATFPSVSGGGGGGVTRYCGVFFLKGKGRSHTGRGAGPW